MADETTGVRGDARDQRDQRDQEGRAGEPPEPEERALSGISTAPRQEETEPVAAGAGSFGGVRAPGVRGGAAWLGRELTGWARWFWRQLTSMRVALLLLLLLALAAVPGSLVPQNSVDATAAEEFRENNPGLGEFYDRLQLFDVYSSIWFSAIYLLLFISLIGCIVPRTWQFVGQLRGRPPRAPRRLNRMPAYTTWRTEAPPEQVLGAAHRLLRKRRFRTDARELAADGGSGGGAVAAEKGYLREAGNLVFHLALIVMLVAFAAGQLFHSEGGKLVLAGDGFANTLTQYDDFSSGTLYDVNDLEQFGFTLDEFHYSYAREGVDLGSAREFRADVTYWTPDGTETEAEIEVNHPLTVGDSKIYLLGHGYAPVVTVTDGQGETAYSGAVPFLPQDNGLSSTGVIKVPDYVDENGEPDQLGFQGFFNPTYGIDEVRGPHSTFPEPDFPVLTLNAFHGDLGIDSGIPQNVYQLNTDRMEQLRDEDGDLFRFDLQPGESVELPDGKGTLTFEGFQDWATFQISTKAGTGWALAGSLAAVLGLACSLLLQRRRVWVRARPGADGRTVVEMASLGRTESARIPEELADLAADLQPDAPLAPDGEAEAGSGTGAGPGAGPGAGDDADHGTGAGAGADHDTDSETDPETDPDAAGSADAADSAKGART